MEEAVPSECSISIQKLITFTLEKKKFTQKSNSLSSCVYVPPSFVVAGTRGGTLYRWLIPEKIEYSILYPKEEVTKHKGEISCMHWSDSLKLLFTGSADRTILVWAMNSRTIPTEPLQYITGLEETPLTLITYYKYLFVNERRGISIFVQQAVKDSSTMVFKKIQFIEAKSSTINSICFSPNSKVDNSGYLYAGLENGTVIQYDAQMSDKPTFSQSNPPKRIAESSIFSTIYFSRTDFIFVLTYDNHVRVFNPRNYRVVSTIKNENLLNYVNALVEDESTHILVDTSGTIFIWEINETSNLVHKTKYAKTCLGIFNASPKKYLFLQRHGISMFDINRGTVKVSYVIHKGTVFYITMLNDSTSDLIATAGDDKFIRTWDPIDFSMRHEHRCPTSLAILSAYIGVRERQTTNMVWAVTGHDEGKIFFINLSDNKTAELPSKHKNSISSITVVQNEMHVLMFSSDYDGFVAVWSIDSILENISYSAVALIRQWKAHPCEILASASQWLTDGYIVATGGNDNVIKLWREVDGVMQANELVGHINSVTALVFEGFFLFSGSEDLTVRIWDTANLVQLLVIQQVHTAAIRSIFYIDGENKFASSDACGKIVVYDYVKKHVTWEMKHTTDCKYVYVEKSSNKLYACVKGELIPHDVPHANLATGLPKLSSTISTMSLRLSGK